MENKVSGSDDLVFSLLCRGWMLTQRRYVNDDWSSRPPLSRPSPASSRWADLARHKAVNLAKTEGGYTLRSSRQVLINSTGEYLCSSEVLCVSHYSYQLCHFPQMPFSSPITPSDTAHSHRRNTGGVSGISPPREGSSRGSNVFRYSQDNLMRGSPSSFSYFV